MFKNLKQQYLKILLHVRSYFTHLEVIYRSYAVSMLYVIYFYTYFY